MPSITTDEFNILVWKYLIEQGYTRSAEVMAIETSIEVVSKSNPYTPFVPNGALVRLVNKGIMYTEAEEFGENSISLGLMEAAMKLDPAIKVPVECEEKKKVKQSKKGNSRPPSALNDSRETDERQNEEVTSPPADKKKRKNPVQLLAQNVKCLNGHTAEAFICMWNPREEIIASGSGDSSGRIWYINNNFTQTADRLLQNSKLLCHTTGPNAPQRQINHDVTSLDWTCDGNLLATGCYDGVARIWNKDGVLRNKMEYHKGPIFAVKWNSVGELMVTAAVDRSTVVWDREGRKLEEFIFHDSSALDVDWISNDTFASCSADTNIIVCSLKNTSPINILRGHENEVNAVRYDPISDRLASCSDDGTLRVWSINESTPLHTFSDHTKEIYTLRWSPLGQNVASASFDHTVRIYDGIRGECIRVLQGHTDPVYSVSYSPDGRYLASGCFDRSVFIWDVKYGQCVAKYNGDKNLGGIFEVSWSHNGTKLAASASDGKVICIDLRKVL